jgi:succinyl-CoA synthetase beta subunit
MRKLDVQVPVVVRLAGTHVEEGMRILAESGLPLDVAADLAEAGSRAVAAWRRHTAGQGAAP